MLSIATQWPQIQFSISNSSFSGSITPSDIHDFDFKSVLLFLKFSISQELYLGEECVMKIWGALEGFTGFAHLMTHDLNTRRWVAETFA